MGLDEVCIASRCTCLPLALAIP